MMIDGIPSRPLYFYQKDIIGFKYRIARVLQRFPNYKPSWRLINHKGYCMIPSIVGKTMPFYAPSPSHHHFYRWHVYNRTWGGANGIVLPTLFINNYFLYPMFISHSYTIDIPLILYLNLPLISHYSLVIYHNYIH